MDDIKSILENLGYSLHHDGACFWRTAAIYRDGNNGTALRISKKNGSWVDFVQNDHGSFQKLIKLSLGLKSSQEASKWLNEKQFSLPKSQKESPKIVMAESWNPKILEKLVRDHSYWNKHGIKTEIVEQFQGGVAREGRMGNRYVFPIFENDKIIGFAGRDITNKSAIKWKIVGSKQNFLWPLHLNRQSIIEKKEVFLVESVGDAFAMFQAGFDNVFSLFGTFLSDKMISTLVGLGLQKIYICLNNDSAKNNVGNQKACEAYLRLIKFVDKEKVQIKLPHAKDFGEETVESIQRWSSFKNIAVIGGREFQDYEKLSQIFLNERDTKEDSIGMIVSGGASGADSLGERWAFENNIPFVKFLPDWARLGRKAAMVRNEYIIQNADKVFAFWNGVSPGTKGAIDIANRLDKPLEIIHYNP